ncbi:SMP-30/gluconolactonase/LRE family protein [Roseiterribacter gracilis]|uniref:SMP-30/Gluconolactonase/LRE-like region domain-containing protein n=1 Tax=Roseiterribacter gracilis TaxID=2812848 RepID=A0A8S8XBS5_9PROT|nr:hypothetical protein TMPK1_10020 [Rhodospirillales bacterium TMPK1]
MRRFLALLVFATLPATAQSLDPARFPAAMREEVEEIAAVVPTHPNDASVIYQIAALEARAGLHDNALATLERLVSLRSGLEPRPRDFGTLPQDPRFVALIARIRADHSPVIRATIAATFDEARHDSEGIAWSSRTRSLYAGGADGSVQVIDSGGRNRTFAQPPGLGTVLGVRVDDVRGELWAVSYPRKDTNDVSGLFRFRLADGKLLRAYEIKRGAGDYLNDVAVTPDGLVYATATMSGAVIRLDPATGHVDDFVPANGAPSANGIAATRDGASLYVATWYAVLHVDRATGAVTELTHAPSVAAGCFDGLYVEAPHTLLGVQNCNHASGRILRLHLDQSGKRILRSEVLDSQDPLAGRLTTGAIAGKQFYFLSRPTRIVANDVTLQRLQVLTLPLASK